MKIVHLASGDLWGGAEVQLYHLACALHKEKCTDLSVVLLNPGQLASSLKEAGIPVLILDETKLTTFEILKAFSKYCRAESIELIHSHRNKENLIAGLTGMKIGRANICTLHGDDEHSQIGLSPKKALVKSLDYLTNQFLMNKIIAVSDELKEKLLNKYKSSKIVAINNSVSARFIENRSQELTSEALPDDSINIGFVGRFSPVKRVFLFLDIAKKITKRSDKFMFHLFGDGPLWQEARDKISSESLDDSICLHGFIQNPAPYIKQLDYLMFTSEHEGLPMTLLEAMTLGTPVISTPLATVEQVLEKSRYGYFPDSEDADQVADFILRECQDLERAKAKAIAAQQHLYNKFSIESNIQKYLKLYQDML